MQRLLKEMGVLAIMAIALVYLANPTAGWIELIPDALPFVGNLDEAGAVLIILSALRYYGVDLSGIFARKPAQLPAPSTPEEDA